MTALAHDVLPGEGSFRVRVPGLTSPRPLGDELPAIMQEDEFCRRFVSAFDEVLAPVFSTIDCWDAYLDVALAPDDFVDWLASWVGIEIDETWTVERRRCLIEEIADLYRRRGTIGCLSRQLELYTDATPRLEDSGGCESSVTADTPLPGSRNPHLLVSLSRDVLEGANPATIRRIVATSCPAHVPFEVEFLEEPNSTLEVHRSGGIPNGLSPGADAPATEAVADADPSAVGDGRPVNFLDPVDPVGPVAPGETNAEGPGDVDSHPDRDLP
jgi:phage tail-like protein